MKSISADLFIKIHNSSETAEEAANKMGITVGSMKVRRSGLIKKGIFFKKFPRLNKNSNSDFIESLVAISRKTLKDQPFIVSNKNGSFQQKIESELSAVIIKLQSIKNQTKKGKRAIDKAITEIYRAIYQNS